MDPFMYTPSYPSDSEDDDQPVTRSVCMAPKPVPLARSVSSGCGGASGGEVGYWDATGTGDPFATKLDPFANTISTDPFAAVKAAPMPEAAQANPAPKWLAPHSTFVTKQSPQPVFLALQAALDIICDIESEATGLRIRGIAFSPDRCCFEVRVYSEPQQTLVEFHRQSGCALTFNSVYSSTLRSLHPIIERLYSSDVKFDVQRMCTSNLLSLDLPLPLDLPELEQDVEDVLSSFVEMMEDGYFEVQREGASGLAQWLKEKTNTTRLSLSQASRLTDSILRNLLGCTEQELVHLGSVCINRIVEGTNASQHFHEALPSLVSVLLCPDMLENRDSKRHITNALKVLAADEDIACALSAFTQDLKFYENAADSALRSNVAGILSLVR
jgi:hypothetical protein